MPPALQKVFDNLKNIAGKLSKIQLIIMGASALFLVVVLSVLFSVSTDQPMVKLFEELGQEDYAAVTAKLDASNYPYTKSGGDSIFVLPEQKNEIIHMLAQEKLMPKGVSGWELFDIRDWDETKFDKDIKLRRVIEGKLIENIQSLRKVKKALVSISVPPTELFENNISPVKAAVILHFIAGVDKLSKKEIQGMITIVERSVPKLKRENITVTDSDGRILSDPLNDLEDKEELKIKIVKLKLQIQEEERVRKLVDIRNMLERYFPDNRYEIARLDLELNWDDEEYNEETYAPIVMKKDNPKTPYDETEVKDNLVISEQDTKETFHGKGFTPDGPAGTEPNLPPGYKDTDYQKAYYEKLKTTRNNALNKRNTAMEKQPWEISKITIAVLLDGIWTKLGPKEDDSGYKRKYDPVAEGDLKKIRSTLTAAMGMDKTRGDQLSVETLAKDRRAEHEAEDAEYRREVLIRRIAIITLVSFLAIFIIAIIWKAIKQELERRRRKREEELARQQQMMREAALRVADDEGAEYELSADERARREMLENAINLAREKPEDVALLLRTWLAEE